MRKLNGITLAMALVVAGLFAILEQRRGVYFFRSDEEPATSGEGRGFGFKSAFFMQLAEWSTYDARFHIEGDLEPDENVVIIEIDDDSLRELHQWPWPRGIHAELIRKLSAAPPKALLFDVLFIEPFTSDPAGDLALVEATRQNPWVVHSFYFEKEGTATPPYKALGDATRYFGFVNAFIDADGVLRSGLLEKKYEKGSLPLLSLTGASLFLNRPEEDILKSVPLDERGQMLIHFVGGEKAFFRCSYAKALSGKGLDPKIFEGKIVVVGATATGTYDHYPAPKSNQMPGVEFHCNVINNLIRGTALRYAGLRFTYLAIGLFGLLCGLFLIRFSAWVGALWALALGLIYTGIAQWFFSHKNIVIDMAGPLLTLALGYVMIVVYQFFTEEREKRWVKAAFGQYVSPKVLEALMADPSRLKLVGERREITVFFSDVAGFTSIAERLNPDELVVLLNRYLSAMTEIIFQYDGYLNKYMGDGIMAFWNAPVKQEDHAEKACRCALKSMARLVALNKELESQKRVPLRARIGINSGTMVVGNMGSVQKSDYTVMGDHVNLGSRLEGANKSFGTSIMISEFTYTLVQRHFEVRFLDIIRVAGKAKSVKTYELLGEKGSLDVRWRRALPMYHEAIQLFTDRQFETARSKFLEVSSILGQDKPCETYVQRAERFILNPPDKDWDGVFELTTK